MTDPAAGLTEAQRQAVERLKDRVSACRVAPPGGKASFDAMLGEIDAVLAIFDTPPDVLALPAEKERIRNQALFDASVIAGSHPSAPGSTFDEQLVQNRLCVAIAKSIKAVMSVTEAAAPPEAGEDVRRFNEIIDAVERRCLAADGPATPTLAEMREDELAELWRRVQAIAGLLAAPAQAADTLRNLIEAWDSLPDSEPQSMRPWLMDRVDPAIKKARAFLARQGHSAAGAQLLSVRAKDEVERTVRDIITDNGRYEFDWRPSAEGLRQCLTKHIRALVERIEVPGSDKRKRLTVPIMIGDELEDALRDAHGSPAPEPGK